MRTARPILDRSSCKLLLLMCFPLFLFSTTFSQTWTGAVSTAWEAAANWSTLTVPSTLTDVTIPAAPSGGRFPTISAGTHGVRDIAIQSGAVVTMTGGTIQLSRDWENSGVFNATGGTLQVVGNATNATDYSLGTNIFFNIVIDQYVNPDFSNDPGSRVYIAGNYTNNNTSISTGLNATFTFNGIGDQIIYSVSSYDDFGHFEVNKAGGTLVLASDMEVAGNATFTTGNFSTSSSNYQVIFKSSVNFNGGNFNANASSISILGNWNNAGSTITGGASVITISGDLTRSGGSFNVPAATVSIGGNWINNTTSAFYAASVTFTGISKSISGISAVSIPIINITTGSVIVNINTTCTGLTFANNAADNSLTISSGVTFTVNGSVNINQASGATTIHAFNVNGGTATVNGDISFNISTGNIGRLAKVSITTGTLSVNGNIYMNNTNSAANSILDMSGGAGTLNLTGNLAVDNLGTLTPGTNSTVNFNGTSPQTINFLSAIRYQNVRVNNTAGVTPAAAITSQLIGGDIRVQVGVLNSGGFSIVGGSGKTFEISDGATFNITGTSGMLTGFSNKTFSTASTVNYSGADQTVNAETYGHLILSGTGTKTLPSSAFVIAGGLTTSGSVSATAASSITIGGNVSLGSGTTLNGGSFTHYVAGNWTNNGATFAPATSTIILNGTSNQTLTGSVSTLNYFKLTLNKSNGSVLLGTNVMVNSLLTFTAGKIQTGNFTIIIAATANVSGAAQSTGWVNGKLQRNFSLGLNVSRTFEVGGDLYYTPATIVLASVTLAGNLTINATPSDHPGLAASGINTLKSVNKYWTLANSGIPFTTFNATFNWVVSDLDGSATISNFKVKTYNGTSWSLMNANSATATSITLNGSNLSGDFVVGELGNMTSWTGSNNSDWNAAGNWNGGIPGLTYSVLIPGGLSNYPVINTGTAVVQDVTIQTGGSLSVSNATVRLGGTLTSNGAINAATGTIEFASSVAQVVPAGAFVGNVIGSLIVDNNAGVVLAGTLNITNLVSIKNGSLTTNNNLVLKSTATTTATVGQITSTNPNPIVGNVTVERYIPGKRKYRLITSSVTTNAGAVLAPGQENLSIWGNWQNLGSNATQNSGTLITGGNTADGFDTQTTNASMFTYDAVNSLFVGFNSANGKNTKYTPLKAGVGYYMFIYGDRQNSVFATNPRPTVLTATGTLATGTQAYTTSSPVPLTNIAGTFTLIGNPYACTIDWTTISRTEVSNTMYGWDPNLSSTGGYVTVTSTGAGALVAPISALVKVNRYIQPGQAFFVQSAGSNPQLTIYESNKVDDNSNVNNQVFRTAGSKDNSEPLMAFNLLYNNAGITTLADGSIVAFNSNFSDNVNDEDALKMQLSTETISIVSKGSSLTINARKPLKINDSIFLNISKLTRSKYTLQIFGKDMNIGNLQPYLEDCYLKTITLLSLTDTNNIVFDVFASIPASVDASRFRIIFRGAGTLAVKFTSITAMVNNKNVKIKWEVATESGMEKYEVERSINGVDFLKIGEVFSKGNSNLQQYDFTDLNVGNGNNYYRIRAVQANGKTQLTEVAVAKMEAVSAIKVYPNPVRNQEINLYFIGLHKGQSQISLTTMHGQQVFSQFLNLNNVAIERIHLKEKLPAGVYHLKVATKDNAFTVPVFVE